jgi:hypothetical protein
MSIVINTPTSNIGGALAARLLRGIGSPRQVARRRRGTVPAHPTGPIGGRKGNVRTLCGDFIAAHRIDDGRDASENKPIRPILRR